MSMETTLAMAVATGRILVLPPVQQMFLVGKPTSEDTDTKLLKPFSFADFFHLESIAEEHVGMEIITMKEFLEREALTGNLRDQKTGEVVFPPNNRTEYDGVDHDTIANELEPYLQRVGMVPPWDPEECVAAFPTTSDPKDVQAIKDMIVDIEHFPTLETFIDKPVPINGTALDRLKEIRANRTKVCIYDEKWQNVQLIHFGEGANGEEGARLLVHFYAFLFFQDWKHDTWMKRFVRDHVRYIDEIQVRLFCFQTKVCSCWDISFPGISHPTCFSHTQLPTIYRRLHLVFWNLLDVTVCCCSYCERIKGTVSCQRQCQWRLQCLSYPTR
jgi:hypothetical protein